MTAGQENATDQRADDIAYLAALVRDRDRPRYYATLFAPTAARFDLFALYGFAAEICRIPDQVKEANLGEIRLQWWLDSLGPVAREEAAGDNPALRAIGALLRRHSLPEAPLVALIEARRRDLYADAPATVGDLEGYFGETESVLFQMAAIVCGASGRETADASGHAGVAYGLARRLARLATDRARGRTIIPIDLAGQYEPRDAQSALSTLARGHLRDARKHAAVLPREQQVPFLALAIVQPLLDRIDRFRPASLQGVVDISHFESLTRVMWARLRGIGT